MRGDCIKNMDSETPKFRFEKGDYIKTDNGTLVKVLDDCGINECNVNTNIGVIESHYPNIMIDMDVIKACGFVFDPNNSNFKVTIVNDVVVITMDIPSCMVKNVKILGPRYHIDNLPYSDRGWCVLSDLQDAVRRLSGNELPIDEEYLSEIILKK